MRNGAFFHIGGDGPQAFLEQVYKVSGQRPSPQEAELGQFFFNTGRGTYRLKPNERTQSTLESFPGLADAGGTVALGATYTYQFDPAEEQRRRAELARLLPGQIKAPPPPTFLRIRPPAALPPPENAPLRERVLGAVRGSMGSTGPSPTPTPSPPSRLVEIVLAFRRGRSTEDLCHLFDFTSLVTPAESSAVIAQVKDGHHWRLITDLLRHPPAGIVGALLATVRDHFLDIELSEIESRYVYINALEPGWDSGKK